MIKIFSCGHIPPIHPVPIKPQDVSIILNNQFFQLICHVLNISGFLFWLNEDLAPISFTIGIDILRIVMPIDNTVVGTKSNPSFPTSCGQLPHEISSFHWRRSYIIICIGGIPQTKPLMVFGRQDNILHSGILSQLNNTIRIEVLRVPCVDQFRIGCLRNIHFRLYPLGISFS
ncbi:hypothetical protein D3C72_1666650 [compost metagenome]